MITNLLLCYVSGSVLNFDAVFLVLFSWLGWALDPKSLAAHPGWLVPVLQQAPAIRVTDTGFLKTPAGESLEWVRV